MQLGYQLLATHLKTKYVVPWLPSSVNAKLLGVGGRAAVPLPHKIQQFSLFCYSLSTFLVLFHSQQPPFPFPCSSSPVSCLASHLCSFCLSAVLYNEAPSVKNLQIPDSITHCIFLVLKISTALGTQMGCSRELQQLFPSLTTRLPYFFLLCLQISFPEIGKFFFISFHIY